MLSSNDESMKAVHCRKVEMSHDENMVLLHRDDPDKEPLVGHVKVTREDWINMARHILVTEGISQVKVLEISRRLEVSRSSFYWYFKSRKELLSALLDDWEKTNTVAFVEHCNMPAGTITGAVCNLFRCFIDRTLFDHLLDFGIREWSRRNPQVREVIDRNDSLRVDAITKMFLRYGYDPAEADTRARVLYYMQIGYYALDLAETVEERLARIEGYLYSFTGKKPAKSEVDSFKSFASQQVSG